MTAHDFLSARRAAITAIAALLLCAAVVGPAAAAPKNFRVHPGVGIGPVSVGDTRAELNARLGAGEKEGPVSAYRVRADGRVGTVKVLFSGGKAKNVFTVDPDFSYRGAHVGMARDQAVDILRGAGFRVGRCGPARAMYDTTGFDTSFGFYQGEVEHIFVVRDPGTCEPD